MQYLGERLSVGRRGLETGRGERRSLQKIRSRERQSLAIQRSLRTQSICARLPPSRAFHLPRYGRCQGLRPSFQTGTGRLGRAWGGGRCGLVAALPFLWGVFFPPPPWVSRGMRSYWCPGGCRGGGRHGTARSTASTQTLDCRSPHCWGPPFQKTGAS